MRVWKAYVQDPSEGVLLSWHASRREAEKAVREWAATAEEPDAGPRGCDPVDIPTDRAGLLAWLNVYFTRDNE